MNSKQSSNGTHDTTNRKTNSTGFRMTPKRISARKQDRVRQDGPTLHTLERKREILGDTIVVKDGLPRLSKHSPADASSALAWMRAKRVLTDGEYQAGQRMTILRQRLYGTGVPAPPSFYAMMVSETPTDLSEVAGDQAPLTDKELEARDVENEEDYDEALELLPQFLRPAMRRLCCGDWWPETLADVIAIRRGLKVWAEKWKLGEERMGEKPILCLDFDGVLNSYSSGWQGPATIPDPPVPGAMSFIAKASEIFRVMIYSSRSKQSRGVKAMQNWMLKHMTEHAGDVGEAVRLMSAVEFPLYKPAAFLTIDDRAIMFSGRWEDYDPLALASFKPWNEK